MLEFIRVILVMSLSGSIPGAFAFRPEAGFALPPAEIGAVLPVAGGYRGAAGSRVQDKRAAPGGRGFHGSCGTKQRGLSLAAISALTMRGFL